MEGRWNGYLSLDVECCIRMTSEQAVSLIASWWRVGIKNRRRVFSLSHLDSCNRSRVIRGSMMGEGGGFSDELSWWRVSKFGIWAVGV